MKSLRQTSHRIQTLMYTLLGISMLSSCHSHGQGHIDVSHQGDSLSIISITQPTRYLLLPIQETSDEALVKLHLGKPQDVYMDIRLAVDSIDYYVPLALPEGSDRAEVYVQRLQTDAIAWSKLRLADTFDISQKDYFHPVYHHTAPYGWMNDPNGLIYLDGEYHLYYQYNPYGSRWGNMHWGHSISKDLIHWEHLEPAISRDTLGHIFSGSTIIDKSNAAGFGKDALLAFYTSHRWIDGKQWQAQSLAYSLDKGRTFTKYEGNPILKPYDKVQDFRDPKVFWYEAGKMWYMIVSADVEMRFYKSSNLKDWTYVSSFGKGWGIQPNQFECPDFFPLPADGDPNKQKWVMLVNINPGCLFGGSATEYFVGDFDGKVFRPITAPQKTKWLDWGKDHYAAVTFSNMGDRVIALPWTSNWQYANFTPIRQHRGANGLPRELKLFTGADGDLYVSANVPEEVKALRQGKATLTKDELKLNNQAQVLGPLMDNNNGAMELCFKVRPQGAKLVHFDLQNSRGEVCEIYLDLKDGKLVMDRTQSGITDFGLRSETHRIEDHDRRKHTAINYHNDFALATWAPLALAANHQEYNVHIFVDKYTIELFVDGGRIAMTNQVFPQEPYNSLRLSSDAPASLTDLTVYRLGL